MIGDNEQRLILHITAARHFRGGFDQTLEQVGLIVAVNPCITAARRSSPIPVSTEGRGSGVRLPRHPGYTA